MTIQFLRKAVAYSSAALILAGLLGAASLARAADDKKPAPKPAAPAKPAAKPASGASGGASHGTTTGAKTGTSGGATTHGPTANHTTTGPSANHPSGPSTSHPGGAANTGHPGGAANASHPGGGAPGAHPGAGGKPTNFSHPGAPGSSEHAMKSGSAIRTRPGGRVSDVHDARRGMDVHHNLGGGRRVSVERADHSRVVAERGRRGYVERGYSYRGHDFGRRAYYYHGHEYNRYYRGYGYRGLYLNVYAPGYYYGPGFYGWAYNPWAAPIAFGWGWGGNPWYGHYGYYFAPYPVYPSAAFWLTDYIISQDLQAAYAAHQEAQEADGTPPATAGGQPVLTPEVKQMIADEVKAQLALENQEATQNAANQEVDPASSGVARLLSDGRPHVFVAGGNLDVTDASGKECVVSDGDTLQLREPPPSDATTANLVVLSSKGNPECQISLTVSVQLTDLQEMQNHMRETIDQGLKDLQDKQGTGGLPAAPASAKAAPAAAQYAAAAPPPETNVSADIQQQDQQSDQAEKEVTAEAAQDGAAPAAGAEAASGGPSAAPPAAPASIELGQTTDQVKGSLGEPKRVANLGTKVIYYYDGMKVTFKDGKVSDVQ
ncbi:MAG TPA: hypothetical protein VMQ56_03230 [Terracidiphilus sp.]|nr:hypothetical protein [Terracidiphilus sp.]